MTTAKDMVFENAIKNDAFLDSLKKAFLTLVSNYKEKLIEDHPEEYYLGKADFGHYNNGLGMVSFGSEDEFDEEQAFEDASEQVIEGLICGEADLWEVVLNDIDFIEELEKFLKGCL